MKALITSILAVIAAAGNFSRWCEIPISNPRSPESLPADRGNPPEADEAWCERRFSHQDPKSATLAISDENAAAGLWGCGSNGVRRVARARPPTCVRGSDKSGPGAPQIAFSEQRRWYANQPSGGGQATAEYTTTRTYYNHRDQAVEVHAPNSPVQRYKYDAKGRQVESSSFAGTKELTRTETTYDDNDRAIATTYWERMHDATADALDETNNVRSFTHTWYDKSGKVIATANYGTNNPVFASGAVPLAYNEFDPPVTRDSTTGQVTGIDPSVLTGAVNVLVTG